jgi:Arc/MetJ family transcription regulator
MATNLGIDEKILRRAYRVGGFRTKREAVNAALTEFVQRHEQRRILKGLGTIRFRKDWDYKADRKKRESRR